MAYVLIDKKLGALMGDGISATNWTNTNPLFTLSIPTFETEESAKEFASVLSFMDILNNYFFIEVEPDLPDKRLSCTALFEKYGLPDWTDGYSRFTFHNSMVIKKW